MVCIMGQLLSFAKSNRFHFPLALFLVPFKFPSRTYTVGNGIWAAVLTVDNVVNIRNRGTIVFDRRLMSRRCATQQVTGQIDPKVVLFRLFTARQISIALRKRLVLRQSTS